MRELGTGSLLGPVFRHPTLRSKLGSVQTFRIADQGSRLLTTGYDKAIRMWQIDPDQRSLSQLKALAELQLTQEADAHDVFNDLSHEQLKQMWETYKSELPEELVFSHERELDWWEHEALRLHDGKHYAEEIAVLTDVLRERPGDPVLLEIRGQVAALIDDDATAIADLNELVTRGFGSPRNWHTLIVAYERSGQIELGIAELSKRLETDPDNAHLWQLRGILHVKLKQWQQAADDLDKAVERGAREIVPGYHSDCLLALGQWSNARISLSKAIDFDRLDARLLEAKIYLEIKLNDNEAARQTFETMFLWHSKSQDPSVANRVAWIEAVHTRVHPARARALSERIVQKESKNYSYLTTLGAAELSCGNLTVAKQRIDEAIAAHGDAGTWREWLLLAIVEHRLNQAQKAKDWFIKAQHWSADQNSDSDAQSLESLSWEEKIDYDALKTEANMLIGPVAEADPEAKPERDKDEN
jgi:tetratricopeptide (TPR) repeat protein